MTSKFTNTEWYVIDVAYDRAIGTVKGSCEDHADSNAGIMVAESGRDREMDYQGIYLIPCFDCRGDSTYIPDVMKSLPPAL